MTMLLYERGLLELDAPISGTIPEFLTDSDPRRREVTLRMLLAHSSGLPAYEKLFLKARTREDLLHAAFTTPLTAAPATRAEYSDIGFIILGVALERIGQEPLDIFCQREVVDTEYPRQRGDHASRLAPEEMVARLHHMFNFMTGRTSTAPSTSNIGQSLESSTASLKSVASMSVYPPTTSLASAKGPSVTVFCLPWTTLPARSSG